MPDICRNLSRKVMVPVFSIWVLAACSNTAAITHDPIATRESVSSDTPAYTRMPTLTPTATPTPTVTPTPTITLTPTPPPDLEFTNVSIYPDTFDEVHQYYLIMGRMRNNTNQIMQFRGEFVAFQFNFEIWDWDKYNKQGGPNYYHAKFQYDVSRWNNGLSIGEVNMLNCFLFPGEEGVVYFSIGYLAYKNAKETGISEYVDSYDGPVGLWYTYESFYETDPTISRAYRIEAQNVQFMKLTTVMSFSFDVDLSQKHIFHPGSGYIHSAWVIIYDKDNKIINILYSNIRNYPEYKPELGAHIAGDTRNVTSPYSGHFTPATKMTPEMIERADRIEVMTEVEEPQVCSSDYG